MNWFRPSVLCGLFAAGLFFGKLFGFESLASVPWRDVGAPILGLSLGFAALYLNGL